MIQLGCFVYKNNALNVNNLPQVISRIHYLLVDFFINNKSLFPDSS